MPPRIGHQKSTAGCRLCKARKVKCDEGKPSCNCPATAAYGGTDSEASSSHEGDTLSNNSHGRRGVQVLDGQENNRSLSLFLLHHFTSVVASTFPSEQLPILRNVYNTEMMRIAFEHDFLLDAVLSVSAHHLGFAQRQPTRCRSTITSIPSTLNHLCFSEVHSLYLDRAVRGEREALSNMTQGNAEAIFFASVMLCISSCPPGRPDRELPEAYDPPTSWLTMGNAIGTVAIAAISKLPHNSAIQKLTNGFSLDDTQSSTNLSRFDSLLEFDDPTTETAEEMDACRAALIMVGSTYEAIRRAESPADICRRLMSFGPLVPPLFAVMLDQRKPRALAILAQFMALVKVTETQGYWWYYGMADREVKGLYSILPPEWHWALDWPLLVVQDAWGPQSWTTEPATQRPPSGF